MGGEARRELASTVDRRDADAPAPSSGLAVMDAKMVHVADIAAITNAAATIPKPTSIAAKANTRSCAQGITKSSKVVISLA